MKGKRRPTNMITMRLEKLHKTRKHTERLAEQNHEDMRRRTANILAAQLKILEAQLKILMAPKVV